MLGIYVFGYVEFDVIYDIFISLMKNEIGDFSQTAIIFRTYSNKNLELNTFFIIILYSFGFRKILNEFLF